MKKFTLGAIVGAGSLAVAFPLVVQISSAASGTQTSGMPPKRPVPSQACIQAIAAKDDAFLSHIDAMIAAQKSATQAHRDALIAAAAIVSDADRQAAVQAAEEAFRLAMSEARKSEESDTSVIDAVRSACGDMMPFGRGHGGVGSGPMEEHAMMRGRGPGVAELAEKLGMTEDELKEAMKDGEDLRALAEEKGVGFPFPPAGGWRGHMKSPPTGGDW